MENYGFINEHFYLSKIQEIGYCISLNILMIIDFFLKLMGYQIHIKNQMLIII